MIMVSYSMESSFYLFHISGSGSAANLGLAIALARLFQTSTYAKYKYRVRFCWWGAEEIGLLGSDDHVKKPTRPLLSVNVLAII
jgi:Zn-dependent M28 family amino/carboxypeptidase